MAIEILYFAWVRELLGTAEEPLDTPPDVATVAELADYLAGRGGAYRVVFGERRSELRTALDQQVAAFDTPLGSAREVAFFPPVTGG